MKSFWTLPILAALGLVSAQAQESVKVSSFAFELGEKWTDVSKGSPMRAAELQFDAEGDDDPVAVFYYFGPNGGGGKDANIKRWKGQFDGGPTDSKEEELAKDGTLLILSGTYLDGPPFGGQKTPKANYKMLAAILPSAQGPVFVKLTAQADVADQALEAFKTLIGTGLD